MTLLVDMLSVLLLLTGGAFGIIGAIGVLRFPDFYSRIHAASLTDTLCAACIILGLVLQTDALLTGVKLLLVLFFLVFTAPVATHALARTAMLPGNRSIASESDEDVDDD